MERTEGSRLTPPERSWSTAGLIAALVVILLYVAVNAWGLAARKPLWIDEAQAFELVVSRQPLAEMLIRGAAEQISPAPLDFMILRAAHLLRDDLSYLGLHPLQYFRAHYLLLAAVVALGLLIAIARAGGPAAGAAFVGVMLPFLVHDEVFPFWAEMRSYGTWVALALAFLFLSEQAERRRIIWPVVALLLGFVSTASSLLLLTWCCAFALVALFQRRSLKTISLDPRALAVVAAGLVTFYFILISIDAPHWTPSWPRFIEYWRGFWPALLLGVGLVVLDLRAGRGERAVSGLTATLWLASGLPVFWLLKRSGYFFVPRQLIYFHAATAWLCFHAIRTAWEAMRDNAMGRKAVAITATVLLTIRVLVVASPALHAWRQLPVEPREIEAVAQAVPTNFEFIDLAWIPRRSAAQWWSAEEMNYCARINFDLWWDWIGIVEPAGGGGRASGTLTVTPYDAWPICQPPCAGTRVTGVRP